MTPEAPHIQVRTLAASGDAFLETFFDCGIQIIMNFNHEWKTVFIHSFIHSNEVCVSIYASQALMKKI